MKATYIVTLTRATNTKGVTLDTVPEAREVLRRGPEATP